MRKARESQPNLTYNWLDLDHAKELQTLAGLIDQLRLISRPAVKARGTPTGRLDEIWARMQSLPHSHLWRSIPRSPGEQHPQWTLRRGPIRQACGLETAFLDGI